MMWGDVTPGMMMLGMGMYHRRFIIGTCLGHMSEGDATIDPQDDECRYIIVHFMQFSAKGDIEFYKRGYACGDEIDGWSSGLIISDGDVLSVPDGLEGRPTG